MAIHQFWYEACWFGTLITAGWPQDCEGVSDLGKASSAMMEAGYFFFCISLCLSLLSCQSLRQNMNMNGLASGVIYKAGSLQQDMPFLSPCDNRAM